MLLPSHILSHIHVLIAATAQERPRCWGRSSLLTTCDRPWLDYITCIMHIIIAVVLSASRGSWKLAEAVQRTQGWCCAGPCITHVLLLGLHLGLQLLGLLLKPVKL
jgi:hypothetical protein